MSSEKRDVKDSWTSLMGCSNSPNPSNRALAPEGRRRLGWVQIKPQWARIVTSTCSGDSEFTAPTHGFGTGSHIRVCSLCKDLLIPALPHILLPSLASQIFSPACVEGKFLLFLEGSRCEQQRDDSSTRSSHQRCSPSIAIPFSPPFLQKFQSFITLISAQLFIVQ